MSLVLDITDKFFKTTSVFSSIVAFGLVVGVTVVPLVNDFNLTVEAPKPVVIVDESNVQEIVDKQLIELKKEMKVEFNNKLELERSLRDKQLGELNEKIKLSGVNPEVVNSVHEIMSTYESRVAKSLKGYEKQLSGIESIIIESPEKILSIPMLSKDILSLQAKLDEHKESVKQISELKIENATLKSQMTGLKEQLSLISSWGLGVLGALSVSIMSFVMLNIVGSWKAKEQEDLA
ncbi:hypothetical protein [Vibrio alginolyticus]|uniref:hypothetical protein n=1 Tax=Vibrio alginolyticus TaxID=663 RepID=UPI001A2CD082|nr:hypothetical protein [Vibrio alginolyticus]MCR9339759.1 hypothetical protein [Vibrio alginolyticus]HAS6128833.1 hypothetical protein [Vibrio vulnificus]